MNLSPSLTLSFGGEFTDLHSLAPSIIVILGGERVSIREYPRSKEGEILPTDRLSEGIFRILMSETPVYY